MYDLNLLFAFRQGRSVMYLCNILLFCIMCTHAQCCMLPGHAIMYTNWVYSHSNPIILHNLVSVMISYTQDCLIINLQNVLLSDYWYYCSIIGWWHPEHYWMLCAMYLSHKHAIWFRWRTKLSIVLLGNITRLLWLKLLSVTIINIEEKFFSIVISATQCYF